jgi:hypothetical protein
VNLAKFNLALMFNKDNKHPAGADEHACNHHKAGNMAVLVQAPRPGLRTFEDTLEASVGR